MININSSIFPSNHFYVLVSGGLDSIAAAHWLKFIYKKNFTVIHFNHNVQDINYDMALKVSNFCYDFNIPLINYKKPQKYRDLSENGLRKFRLDYLSSLEGDFVTGHHLNDAVESSMMMLFKGTPEYKPIKEVTKFTKFNIFHPFLKTTKLDFKTYIKNNNLQKYIVEDPSNNENSPLRNWIRNVVLPEIETRINMETIIRKKFYV